MEKPIILICGVPHSLTSMVANFLIDNGAYAKKTWDNPKCTQNYSRFEDKENQNFLETNNMITFSAYQLPVLYPKSKFIHLIKNPNAFIKSSLFRHCYTGNNSHDEGRIVCQNTKPWNKYCIQEKITRLWGVTNDFIQNFKDQISDERIVSIRFEDLLPKVETSYKIFCFSRYTLTKHVQDQFNNQKVC